MTGRHWKTQTQNSEKISVGYLQEPVSKPYCNMTGRHRKYPHKTPWKISGRSLQAAHWDVFRAFFYGILQCLPVVLYTTGRSLQAAHWNVFRVFFVWDFPVPASWTLQAGPNRKPTEMFSECSLCGIFQCLPAELYRQVPAGNPLRCFQSVLCVGVSSACQLYFTGRSQQETHWDLSVLAGHMHCPARHG